MRAIKWVAGLALAAMVICAVVAAKMPNGSHIEKGTAVVKVLVGSGHGSGVHLGGGYILSAAHVVGKESTVKLKSSLGDVQSAEVLWVNTVYDVALLKASRPERFASSRLSCKEPKPGTYIRAEGNPANMEFVTVFGQVSGIGRTVAHWRHVIVTNITVVPGQSGGPVYDDSGEVVAITVGVMVAPVGMFSASLVGVGYAVPASTVCDLMARGI